MKAYLFSLFLLLGSPLGAICQDFYIGAHHNYTKLDLEDYSDLKGYQTGIALGYEVKRDCFFAEVIYEGYWTLVDACGDACNTSGLREYSPVTKNKQLRIRWL